MLAEVATAATLLAGHSVEGKPLRALRTGHPGAPTTVLVVGSVHGDEPGGHAVVRALRARRPPAGVQVWTLRTANPDGERRGTRTNARGVDLNRNFGHRWRPGPPGRHHPGSRPFSEPETRAIRRLVRRLRPQLTVYFHQPYGFVVRTRSARLATLRRYGRLSGLPLRRLPRYRGTAVGWQRAADPASESFVVELPSARVRAARHARAVLRVAAARARAAGIASRPPMRWHPIPFGADRRRQMRAYARRHSGLRTARLVQPRTVVHHYAGTDSFQSVVRTFAANAPDPELGERPGVCTHFVIDRAGRIHQLVRLRWMCRHVIGLNHVSIGIEHVGTSDAEIMGNRRQLNASLALSRWLMDRYAIPRDYVIGHAESLSSPFHRERVRWLRHRTHGDMGSRTMARYRRLLSG